MHLITDDKYVLRSSQYRQLPEKLFTILISRVAANFDVAFICDFRYIYQCACSDTHEVRNYIDNIPISPP